MKTKLTLVVVFACLATAGALFASLTPMSGNCPIDGGSMYFTGSTKTVNGKLLYQYRCPQGHTTWVVQ